VITGATGVNEAKERGHQVAASRVRLQPQGGRMIRQTPSRRVKVLVTAVAGATLIIPAALAATSSAPDGSASVGSSSSPSSNSPSSSSPGSGSGSTGSSYGSGSSSSSPGNGSSSTGS